MSLLAALDRSGHDVELRCVEPPLGVEFAGAGSSEPAGSATEHGGGGANYDGRQQGLSPPLHLGA